LILADLAWFAPELIAWQRTHGRHGLPWQATPPSRPSAYAVWLSEVMLQQTQVVTVVGYYQRFLQRFPTVKALAEASEDEVLALWSGLGYYSRARNLHRAAQLVMTRFGGEFPREPAQLQELPGVGRSTAAAIAAFSFGARATILDGNVKRVLSRVFALADAPSAKHEAALWALAESLTPSAIEGEIEGGIESYTQGLMDLGATLCTRSKPACAICPMSARCEGRKLGIQHQLPTRKVKTAAQRTRRVEQCALVVATHRGEVYLEQRPSTGVWARLWSFPQFASVAGAQAWATTWGAEGLFREPVKHSFTHFDLLIEPLYLQLAAKPEQVAETGGRWVKLAELDTLGVPAVVAKLLAATQ
jgi:A/G-specific adenine glycosylase